MNPDGGSGTAPFPERPDFASRARAHAPALPEMLRKLRTADHLLSCCLTARQIWSVGAPSRQAPKARRGGAAYKSSPTSKGATTPSLAWSGWAVTPQFSLALAIASVLICGGSLDGTAAVRRLTLRLAGIANA